MITFHSEPEI